MLEPFVIKTDRGFDVGFSFAYFAKLCSALAMEGVGVTSPCTMDPCDPRGAENVGTQLHCVSRMAVAKPLG